MKKLVLLSLIVIATCASIFAQELEPHKVEEQKKQLMESSTNLTIPSVQASESILPASTGGLSKEDGKGEQKFGASSLSGYELEVDGEARIQPEGLGGLDLLDATGSLMGLLRHTTGNPGTMYLSNFQGELQLYSEENEITMYLSNFQGELKLLLLRYT